MKRTSTVGLILATLLVSTATQAETDESNKQQHRLQRLQAELKLTDPQKDEIGKIFDEARPQLEALRKQGQELREKMQARLKAVLTAEQMEKYEKLHQQRKERRLQGRLGSSDD